jgi:hypothetical protein
VSTRVPGQVIGRAGTGLATGNNGWAANADVARIGRGGELRTAALLNDIAKRPGGPTVLHDLTIPGSRANIDHVVVSGRRITLLDTKVWKPGTYWRVFGMTFRGAERFKHADKDTMAMAVAKLHAYLSQRGAAGTIATPLTVVWPSRPNGGVRMLTYGGPHGRRRLIPGDALPRSARRLGDHPADPNVVAALVPLVAGARPAMATSVPRPRRTW